MIAISRMTGKHGARDSGAYFSIGVPVFCVASLVLGWIEPDRSSRWTAVMFTAQFVAMLVTAGPGNLQPNASTPNIHWAR